MNVRVAGAWEEAESVRAFELELSDGQTLPPFVAGAHLEVTFPLATGPAVRRYSLSGDPANRSRYRIAVLREPNGRGGSAFMHERVGEGDMLDVSQPRNEFQLDETTEHTVLIAGGIGITPIISMAYRLNSIGASFELHYAARTRERLAFIDELEQLCGSHLWISVNSEGRRLDLPAVLGDSAPGRHAYVCGPRRLIEGVRSTASKAGWAEANVHFESFGAHAESTDRPVHVELRQSGMSLDVPVGTSILEAMLEAGVFASYECERGECGMCSTTVVEGEPDHRDHCLTGEQQRSLMCTCVSWAKSDSLVLDL